MITKIQDLAYENYPCLVFDFDGTIADTLPYIVDTARKALTQFGMKEEELPELRRLVGPAFPEAFVEVCGVTLDEAIQITEMYRKIYFTLGAEAWPPFDGIEELLGKLKAAGKKLCIASSKNEFILKKSVEEIGLIDYFDLVLGRSLDGQGEKAEFIVQAFEELGFHTDEVLMIGDRHFDVDAAKRAGVACVGVSYGGAGDYDELLGAGASCIVDSVEELGELLLGE